MKVCFIVNQFGAWGKIGGFGVNTRRIAAGLAALGHEVSAVIPRRNGPNSTEVLDGVTIHSQSDLEVFTDGQIYRQIDADIYHSEEPTICTYWAQRAMPERIHVVTSRDPREASDWWIELRNATWPRRLKYPFQRFYEDSWLTHKAVRNADGVYVEAEFLQAKAQRLYGLSSLPGLLSKPIEIPPGPFEKAERPLCVFLGRFDKRKRPEMFFDLAERMPDVNFVAIGRAHDQSYQDFLERRYFDLPNLEAPGYIDPFRDDRLHQILSRAWLLVHPAAREGMPTVFHEASAREMGIVAFIDPGGYTARFGRVVPETGGLEELAAAVRAEIESGDWRDKGRAGRLYNQEHHSIDAAVRLHLDAYSSHLERRRPGGNGR